MSRNLATTFLVAISISLGVGRVANAATTSFFSSSQTATPVSSGATSDTISSDGYRFTYTRDKLFTGGGTATIGRPVLVTWPNGVEAQAVTAGSNPSGAKITIQRVDGGVFDLTAFTMKLLANTGGAGASLEIMPTLNGQDAWNDPLAFFATGYYSNSFSYNSSPSYLGSTSLLKGFDKYTVSLYVDYALTALTMVNPDPVPSTLAWSGAVNGKWDVNTSANFTGATTGKYKDGDYVTFDDTGTRTAVTIATGGVSPGSLEFANTPAKSYSISGGPIQGPSSLVLSGGGRVVLSNTNSYTGSTIVSLGTLQVLTSKGLPDGGDLIVGTDAQWMLGSVVPAVAGGAPVAVPEPSTLALVAIGTAVTVAGGWRRRTA